MIRLSHVLILTILLVIIVGLFVDSGQAFQGGITSRVSVASNGNEAISMTDSVNNSVFETGYGIIVDLNNNANFEKTILIGSCYYPLT